MHLLVGGHERAWIENCVCGLGRLEKTLNFLRCILVIELVLKCGSDIIERNWLDLFFHIILLIGIVASVFKTSFSSCILGFRLKFSIIALWRSRLQLDSKSDLTATGFFGVLCQIMHGIVDFIAAWTAYCMNCSIVILLQRQIFLSVFSMRGILVSSLKVHALFNHRIL